MRVALPLFRTVKLRSFELPTVTVPKSSEAGVTPINGTGVSRVHRSALPAPTLGSLKLNCWP